MASFEIQFKSSAERDLQNIDKQYIPRIIKTIESLAANPFPLQYCKLRGTERLYRIRVGDYRVIYQVDTEAKIVTIYSIRHRRSAYRRL